MIGLLIAGGKGTRLGADPVSKPMVDVGGRPLYTYGVRALASVGAKAIIVIAGAHKDLLMDVRDRYRVPPDSVDRPSVVGFESGVAPTILAAIAEYGPFYQDVAMCFGDEWFDLAAVREFRKSWNGIPDALLFFVRGESIARKTYTAIVIGGYPNMPRIHRLIEKPTWVPHSIDRQPLAGTGLAIVKPEVANAALELRDHTNWVDLFQVGAIDRGRNVFAVPTDSEYHNVNTQADLDALRRFLSSGRPSILPTYQPPSQPADFFDPLGA